MKRLILLFFILAPMWANAQTMCVRDKSLVISLDSGISGTDYGHNPSEWIWWVDFSYGRIYGDATCLSAAEGLGRTSGMGKYYGIDNYASTFIDVESGLSGTDVNGDARLHCWCRVTHPIFSHWVYGSNTVYYSATDCKSKCPDNCANRHRAYSQIRFGTFGSVGL